MSKTDWGEEDWSFIRALKIRKKVTVLRELEPTLVHVYHPKVSWSGSRDGITKSFVGHRAQEIPADIQEAANTALCQQRAPPIDRLEHLAHTFTSTSAVSLRQRHATVLSSDPKSTALKTSLALRDNLGCDLRKCDQNRYPFTYMLTTSPTGSSDDVRGLISSIKESATRCTDHPPAWYDCLCIYVVVSPPASNSRYSHLQTPSFAKQIHSISSLWRHHVRVLSVQRRSTGAMLDSLVRTGSHR